jgi:glycogen synthase
MATKSIKEIKIMTITEKKQVEKIKEQYVANEGSKTKMEELKALHKRVKLPARIFGYVFGTIGSLVLGTGMCLAMEVIGDLMALGIVVGVVGIGLVSLTYPIYKKILKSRKKKYAKQIVGLSDRLLNE